MLLISLLHTYSSVALYLNTSQKVTENCIFHNFLWSTQEKNPIFITPFANFQCNFRFFLLVLRTFFTDCMRIECVYEIHIHCIYSVSGVSLKIYLFVHLINSCESFDAIPLRFWIEWIAGSCRFLIYVFTDFPFCAIGLIACQPSFIYYLSCMCTVAYIGCVYVRLCCEYVHWFFIYRLGAAAIHVQHSHFRIACYQTIDMIIFFNCTKANAQI